MTVDILLLILGLVVLIGGGEFLVRGAVGVAQKLKLSKLIIGVTIVSFGTSAPELLVSLNAVFQGDPEISIGNVVGSNIANLALVLSITILIIPIAVKRQSIRLDWPVMMLASVLFYVFALNRWITRWEGALLFLILVGYIIYLVRSSRKANKKSESEGEIPDMNEKEQQNSWLQVFYLILGFIGLYFGSEWLLDGAVGIAKSAGMTKRVVGVTIIAFGTSFPELVTSGMAAIKKETDISVGNLIGSNIFNIMAVIGITAMAHPLEVDYGSIHFDMLWMLAIAAALLPMMALGKKMGRLKGFILLLCYLSYIGISVYQLY